MFVTFPHASVIASTLAMAKRRLGLMTAGSEEHSVLCYNLDDLDTAFPSSRSIRLKVTYTNGEVGHYTTNLTLEEFKETFMGAEVRQSYYAKHMSAQILTILDITLQ